MAASRELKSLLIKVKEERERVGLKLKIQKTKIMPSGPITSWEMDGKQWKQWMTLYFVMECLLQQFDDCRTMGEDKTTCPFSNGTWVAVLSGGKLFGLLLLGTTSSYKSLLNKSSQ